MDIILKKQSDDFKLEEKLSNENDYINNNNNIELQVFNYVKNVSKGRVFTNINNSGRIDLWKKAIKHIKTVKALENAYSNYAEPPNFLRSLYPDCWHII